MTHPLGRREPTDWEHVRKYPLTALATDLRPARVPVTIGVNWYREFDNPVRDSKGNWWVARDGRLTKTRGGHCVVLLPRGVKDKRAWWVSANQGAEGACVGFGSSRMMTLLNRKRYDPWWLWNESKKIDEWSDTNPGDSNGTSVRAAMDVLRVQGHRRVVLGKSRAPRLSNGIAENRWAESIDDVLRTLGRSTQDAIPFLNSWGTAYPHVTWMPASVYERLMREGGEFALVTDR